MPLRLRIATTGALALLPACGSGPPPPPAAPIPAGVIATGAVDSLGDSTLAGRHVESVVELLQGRVAGLQVISRPNGDISLRIRGGTSLSGQSEGEPLLIIDGMAVASPRISSALRALKPHEIDNIQVLKDVASIAVYGTRGAHGVILITTKRK